MDRQQEVKKIRGETGYKKDSLRIYFKESI